MTTLAAIIVIALAGWLVSSLSTPMARSARLPLAAALALGLAGYSWQGRPGLAAAPAARAENNAGFGDALSVPINGFTPKFGAAARWIGFADALARRERFSDASGLLNGAVRRYPDNPDLWFAYADALVNQGQGQVSPAALVALDRVATLRPDHPGPAILRGLAAAQKNDLDGALAIWRGLLERTPADAPYRQDIEARIKVAQILIARRDGEIHN